LPVSLRRAAHCARLVFDCLETSGSDRLYDGKIFSVKLVAVMRSSMCLTDQSSDGATPQRKRTVEVAEKVSNF
jgi:hypothetical protein